MSFSPLIFSHAAGLFAFLLLPHEMPKKMVIPMTDESPALSLDVQHTGNLVEVRLIGNAAHMQEVSYLIEVTGQSTSRHRGTTTLTGGTTAVLSTMRANVGADWCVKLVAEEAGREPYEVIRGTCAAPAD